MKCFADSHVHARFTEFGTKKVKCMLDEMAETGLTDVCLLSLPYRGAAENLQVLYWKMHYDKMQVRAFGGIHVTDRYALIAPEVMVEHLLDLGCDGIKLMNAPGSRRFRGVGFHDPKYERMFSLLEDRDVPMNIHTADPEDWWNPGRLYANPSYPSNEQIYRETFEVLDRHPKLRVVFPHFFFLSNKPDEAVRVMETYPNVSFDITPGVEMYENFDNHLDFWHDFFTKYADRILFGTDCNTVKSCNKELVALVYRKLTEKKETFTQHCYGKDFVVHGLGLSDDVVEKICGLNYLRLVGEKKKVNVEKFYAGAERILHDIQTMPEDPIYIAGGDYIPALKEDPGQQRAVGFCKTVLAERDNG